MAVRKDLGILRTWEPLDYSDNGNLGCGVIVDPRDLVDTPEADGNYLFVTRVAAGTPAVYWAGTAWDRGGAITTPEAFDTYLDNWAVRVRVPVTVGIAKR
jgi:hypothetical protein